MTDLEQQIRDAIDAGAHADYISALGDQLDAQDDARLREPGALGRAAVFYAKVGLHVFPLKPGEKRPLIPSAHPGDDPRRNVCKGECGQRGHGLYDATTDVATVTRWWRREPTANIGLRTGLRFDVVDIDGPDGFASLRAMSTRPTVLGRVSTTRGDAGAHLFISPTGAGNGSKLAPGIDYRGDFGYIVAPPSFRQETGRYWRWTQPLDLGALS